MAIAGATVTQRHYDTAVKLIQEAHNDAIGAPKVIVSYLDQLTCTKIWSVETML